MPAFDLGLVDGNVWAAASVDSIELAINKRNYIGTAAERAALVGMTNGDGFRETDTQREYRYTGSGWTIAYAPPSERLFTQAYVPGGSVTATTTGSFVDWITFTSPTIPPWATRAVMHLDATYVATTGAGAIYATRVILSNGASNSKYTPDGAATRIGFAYNDVISFTNIGAQALKLQALRASGAGQWAADTAGTAIQIVLEWQP